MPTDQRPVTCLAIMLVAGAAVPTVTSAQGAGPRIEEIVVTARKREETVQDAALSVTALTPELLEQRVVENLRDLQGLVPSLSVVATQAGSSANAQVYLRGIGQYDYRVTSDQGVGLYVDGVYFARSMAASLDVLDVERIEVLRGPQGTLFGRNTLGGAVQVISVKPQPEFEAAAETTLGSRSRFDLRGMLNAPLVDETLLLRVSAARLRQDGYGLRLFTGEDTGDTYNDALRAQLLWHASEDFSVLLALDGARRRGNSSVETLLGIPGPEFLEGYNADLEAQGLLPVTEENFVTGSPYRSWAGGRNGDNYDAWGASVTLDWDIGARTSVRSISAFRGLGVETAFDFGNVPYPLSTQEIDIWQRAASQEIQLNYATEDARLRLVSGVFAFFERGRETDFDPYFELPIATGEGPLSFTRQPVGTANRYEIFLDQRTRSYAAYTQGSFALTPVLDATLGLRYTRESKDLLNSTFYQNTYEEFEFERALSRPNRSWNDVSPLAGLEYRWAPGRLAYATISRGYRSGGFNGVSFDEDEPESFDPERIVSYEIGLKADWIDGRLRTNATTFLYDYDNVVGTALQDAAFVVSNIGKLYVYGIELETTILLTDALRLHVGSAFLDQSIRSVVPGGEETLTPASRLPNLPKWSGDIAVRYEYPLGALGTLTYSVDYAFRGRSEFLLPNYEGEAQAGYGIANASLSFMSEQNPVEAVMFVRNFTDKAYRLYGENDVAFGLGTLHAQFGRPREWGLTLRYRF